MAINYKETFFLAALIFSTTPIGRTENILPSSQKEGLEYVKIAKTNPKLTVALLKDRLIVLNKESLEYDTAYINPQTLRLVPNPELQKGGEDISVVRHLLRNKNRPTNVIRFFDIQMNPTIYRGFHEARAEYNSWHSGANLQSFFDEKGHPTLMDKQVAFISYTRVFFFSNYVFISFLNEKKQPTVWNYKNQNIIWIFHQLFTPKMFFLCSLQKEGMPPILTNTLGPDTTKFDISIMFTEGFL